LIPETWVTLSVRRDLQGAGFEPAGLVVEVSQIIVHKADEPNPVFGLFDSDGRASEDLAEIDFLDVEADAAAGRDSDGLVVEGIVEVRQSAIGP
jgi:hypothetical protein